jgi:hypothetical protein
MDGIGGALHVQIFWRECGCSGLGMSGVIVPPTGPFMRLLSMFMVIEVRRFGWR